jgi:hypothetical protein
MTLTTTSLNACDAVIKLDNTAGNLADISGSSNEVTMDLTNDLGKVTAFGGRFPLRKECKSDATINLKAVYSGDDAEALLILMKWYFTDRGSRTITISIPDDSPGADLYTFEVFLESLNVPAKSDDPNPILVSAVMKPTGTYTWTTVGS